MYAPERQQAIAALVREQGRVSVGDIAGRFAVTTETVRRDLASLERSGLVHRVHGGAVAGGMLAMLETEVDERERSHAEEKDRIAKAALGLLPAGATTVLIDAGTTTQRLATALPSERELTILTNSVTIAHRLAGNHRISIHLVGGRVRSMTQACVGASTVEEFSRVRVDVAFLGTNGFSVEHGFSTPDHEEAAVKNAMIAAARQAYVLADSSKAGAEHLVSFALVEAVDALVTNAGDPTAEEELARLEKAGLEVVRA
jgi:DeoR family transcriptional regulator, fructose operon transcriptional repressor